MLLKNTTVRGPVKKQEFIFTTSISSFNPQREKRLKRHSTLALKFLQFIEQIGNSRRSCKESVREMTKEKIDISQSDTVTLTSGSKDVKNVVINRVSHRGSATQVTIRIKFSVDKKFGHVKSVQNLLLHVESRVIIERVTTAPNWISGISMVAKGKEDFRLIVNMTGANKAINRDYYCLPLLEEMKVKL